ncbi:hypothetical protein DID80_08415 [Candidatus Marinamargulisbacteria bacterium SCGC AAA071-K20]|nr:hypothetical protein DID80_08415 [Candidatus Marinamargulisbacteria bacterium SCGC AAA071-K20]
MQNNTALKVLAFTASSKRPIYLRHCILQLQNQSVSVDHGIYINSPDYQSIEDKHNYSSLIDDIGARNNNQILVAYGPSASHHQNHMAAANLFDINTYDLFLKIDDDDIYRKHYVRDVVADYLKNGWDFSGAISQGHINKDEWRKNDNLRSYISDSKHKEGHFMPPTFAWTKKAMTIINSIDNIVGAEDSVWKDTLLNSKDIKVATREQSNFSYNIHTQNNTINYEEIP